MLCLARHSDVPGQLLTFFMIMWFESGFYGGYMCLTCYILEQSQMMFGR